MKAVSTLVLPLDVNELAKTGSVPVPVEAEETVQGEEDESGVSAGHIRDVL